MGYKNSLKSRIPEKNSSCFVADCNCHLVHLVAGKKGDKHMRAFPALVLRTINVVSIIFLKAAQEEYLEFVELHWENIV